MRPTTSQTCDRILAHRLCTQRATCCMRDSNFQSVGLHETTLSQGRTSFEPVKPICSKSSSSVHRSELCSGTALRFRQDTEAAVSLTGERQRVVAASPERPI